MDDKRSFLSRYGRRIVVGIVGTAVLISGFVLSLPLVPGPGILIMIAGLAILSTEFEWAERWRQRVKARAEQAARSTGTSVAAIVGVGIFLTAAIGVAAWLLLK
ncbi:MAG: PGPGW domain-containing protein [Actinomycetota bacterium]